MRIRLLSVIVLVVATASAVAAPENLALKAKVTATSEFSAAYLAKFVADGIIPKAGRQNSEGQEWAVQGKTHKNGAELTMKWPGAVTIAEVVYYGRTSYAVEAWKACEVYLDDSKTAAVKATFKPGHGPQRVKLSKPANASTLRLKFIGSHACDNPGASEIQVYSQSPSNKVLGKFTVMAPMHGAAGFSIVDESPQLTAELHAGKLGFKQMLLVHRHEFSISHVYTYHVESFRPGGGIYIHTPGPDGGELKKIFDSGAGEIMDCRISHDAKEILFSYKKQNSKGWNHLYVQRDGKYQIYRMSLADLKPKLLTDETSNNFNPCWLPDGGIVFLSDRKLSFAYCWTSSSPLLYRMDGDGSNVVKISHGYLNDFTPSVLNDGRVIYSRWEYVDRPAIPIQSLWTLKPDGTKLEGFFGNRVLEPGTFMEARSIGNTGKVLCVLTAHNGSCRGALGVIDPSFGANAQKGIRNVTPEVPIGKVDRGNGNALINRGPYENPCPIDETYFMVSKRGTILLRDYDGTKKVTVICPKDGMGFYSPQPIRAVKPPRIIPSMLPKNAEPWGTMVVQDVYNGLEGEVKRGEIKQIAVVEEIEKGDFAPFKGIFGFQFPLVSCGASYAPKRLWGYATVEKDGSAHFKVPSERPIYFLALDDKGRAVQRMRSFTHLQPGERQSCIGCHADRNYATARTGPRATAALRKSEDLQAPEWGRRGFDYSSIVQPVLDKHCVKCHNAREMPKDVDLTGDKTDFFCVSYEHLARKGTHGEKSPMRHGVGSLAAVGRNPYVKWMSSINGSEAGILMIAPRTWGAYPSKLTQIILSGHPDKDGKKRFEMDEKSVRRMMAWMDLNVVYYDNSKTNHPGTPGSRWIIPRNLNSVLENVRKKRCARCHKAIPRKFYTRITNIEDNNFLLAPLAKTAGGTEACKKAIFKSKDDPDYQAIVKTFEPITKLMKSKPRLDFPGSKYIPHSQACPPKRIANAGK